MAIKEALRFVLGLSCAGLVGLGSLVGVARPASAAVPFAMSGHHRNWCCSKAVVPNGVLPTPTFPSGTLTITGDYAAFPFGAAIDTRPHPGLATQFPYGTPAPSSQYGVQFSGLVNQTGLPMTSMNPATLSLPTGAFAFVNQYTDASHGSTWTYIRTTATLSNAQATFMAGAGPGTVSGGPGSYSFCRAATGTPPGITPCTAPPGVGGVGDPNFPWQVSIQAGANRFGGTMALLGNFAGVAKFKPPSLGGANRNVYFSFVPNSGHAIPAIGPLTNIIKFTLSGSPLPVMLPTPSGGYTTVTQVPNFSYQSAAPLTTGTISVRATVVTSPFLYLQAQVTGSDNRTANGAGNIQLVTPVVYTNTGSHQGFPRPSRWRMTLPEPSGALGLGAGIAGLFGLGCLRRRRERRA